MERAEHNPWSWQEEFGFVQGNQVQGAERTLYCAGQTAMDENGAPQHAGDMRAQAMMALDNLEAVLSSAKMSLENVVRLNVYTTDIDGLFEHYGALAERLGAGGCRHAGTLLQVSRLAFPELMVELEATAVA